MNKKVNKKLSKMCGGFSGITIRLPSCYIDVIEDFCEKSNMKKGAYIRKVLLDYLDFELDSDPEKIESIREKVNGHK